MFAMADADVGLMLGDADSDANAFDAAVAVDELLLPRYENVARLQDCCSCVPPDRQISGRTVPGLRWHLEED